MSTPSEHSPTADAMPVMGSLVLTIEEAAQKLGIGRTLMYSLVASGEIESVTIGRLRRIPAECLNEYVQRLRSSTQQSRRAA